MTHYGFFLSQANDVFNSVQGTSLLSSTTYGGKDHLIGRGTYMYPKNIRHCIALFCVRSIPKPSWVNDSNVYIGRIENDTK